MKVGEAFGNRQGLSGAPVRDELKIPDTGEASFKSRLLNVENQRLEDRINFLVDKINIQSEILAKKADIRELKIYKQLISEFLDQVVGNSHRFSKRNFLDRRGRHRVYAIVQKVDEELEKLTADVLSSEKDNLTVLHRLDDIRGLILDLIL